MTTEHMNTEPGIRAMLSDATAREYTEAERVDLRRLAIANEVERGKVAADMLARYALQVAAAEKLAQAVEDYCAADGNEFGEHAWWPEWKEMWSALAHYRELCPVTAQDARQ